MQAAASCCVLRPLLAAPLVQQRQRVYGYCAGRRFPVRRCVSRRLFAAGAVMQCHPCL